MKLGYHAIPSFEPLHLSIISSDMDSPCITKREHIVSFIPLFFVEPELLERHLESAFADSMMLSVRKERAQSVRESTPMACTRCGRGAVTVPDWKRHNHICNITPTNKGTRRLNSLLGWSRKVVSKEESGGTEPIVPTHLSNGESRKSLPNEESRDIEPMTPTNFTIRGASS